MPEEALDGYDAEHIREQLIADPRINALDVQVSLTGDALVLTGNAATAERKQTIADVVAEMAPGVEVRNDITVPQLTEPSGREVIS